MDLANGDSSEEGDIVLVITPSCRQWLVFMFYKVVLRLTVVTCGFGGCLDRRLGSLRTFHFHAVASSRDPSLSQRFLR